MSQLSKLVREQVESYWRKQHKKPLNPPKMQTRLFKNWVSFFLIISFYLYVFTPTSTHKSTWLNRNWGQANHFTKTHVFICKWQFISSRCQAKSWELDLFCILWGFTKSPCVMKDRCRMSRQHWRCKKHTQKNNTFNEKQYCLTSTVCLKSQHASRVHGSNMDHKYFS